MTVLPLLVVTPHSAGHVPQDVLGEMLGDARHDLDARRRRHQRLFEQGDPFTDLLFDVPGAHALHATVSRFVADANRVRHDLGPNGIVKSTDFDGVPLYPTGGEPAEAAVEERLRRYWDPFHAEIRRVLQEHPVELLLDGHSMVPLGPSLGPDRGRRRPAFTLMTGGDARGERASQRPPTVAPHTARALRDAAGRHFAALLAGAEKDGVPPVVALNDPWRDDELSHQHGPPAGIPAFGLEINRALYLEPPATDARPRPQRIAVLQVGLAAFCAEAVEIVRSSAMPGGAG